MSEQPTKGDGERTARHDTNRRDFVKIAGAATAAGLTGLSGCLDSLSSGDNGSGDGDSEPGSGGSGSGDGDSEAGEWRPEEAISHIVPYSEGGSTDVFARQMAPHIEERLGQPVAIENIPGAGTLRGLGELLRRPGDGHHTGVGFNPGAALTMLFQGEDLNWKVEDLTVLGAPNYYSTAMFTNPEHEIQDFPDLFERYQDGEFSRVGGLGLGHSWHVIAMIAREQAGFEWETFVNYDGGSPLIAAVERGEIPAAFMGVNVVTIPKVEDGLIDLVGYFSSEPEPGWEDVDCYPDFDYPSMDYLAVNSRVLFGPQDMDEDAAEAWENTAEDVLQDEEFRAWAEESGNILDWKGSDEAREDIESVESNVRELLDVEAIKEDM